MYNGNLLIISMFFFLYFSHFIMGSTKYKMYMFVHRSSSSSNHTSWEEFYMDITERELYPIDSQPLQRLLHDMETLDIVHVGKFELLFIFFKNTDSNGRLMITLSIYY